MPTFECDICIVGGGISAALLSQKVAELRPGTSIIVVETGDRLFDLKKRLLDRQRSMAYGENPWPGDYVEDQSAHGVISRTMAVGGSALHWGGVTQSLLAGRPAVEVDVRTRDRLADRVGRARAFLLRSRAAYRRVRRDRAVSGRQAARSRTRCRSCRCRGTCCS